jgi:2-phospho-L-lactate guanylyltransferase
MDLWAVVPMKPFPAANRRLRTVLDGAERAQLARTMLEDVIDAVVASRHVLTGWAILTADHEAARIARDRGALVLTEAAPDGLNRALARAIAQLLASPQAGMLVIPSDLPHLSVGAIERIASLLDAERAVALVPATVDGGTNILACRPPGVIEPSFGPGSAERHRSAAVRAGITPILIADEELGRDLDRPADLAAFLAMGVESRTRTFLSALGLPDRMRADAMSER